MKNLSPMIRMKLFNTFFLFLNSTTMTILWGKSEPPLLNNNVKVVNRYVKDDMDLKKYVSKVVGYRLFFRSKSIKNYCHSVVLKGEKMKPPKCIKYVLVGCNSFLTLSKHMKGCIVVIYNQVLISDIEEMNKYSMFK